MPRPPANQKAFTLIEVMMAAAVLVVGFTAVIQAVTMGGNMVDTARKQQIAQQIIEEEVNSLRRGPWSAIAGFANGTDYVITVDGTGSSLSGDTAKFILNSNSGLLRQAAGFTCHAQSLVWRSSGPPTFLQITYTVNWADYLNRPHTRMIVAYFCQNGLHLSYQK